MKTGRCLMTALLVVLAFSFVFTSTSVGCSAPTLPNATEAPIPALSPMPESTPTLEPNPMATPEFQGSVGPVPEGTEAWREAAHTDGVPGTVYAIIDGKRVEVTVGSVIGMATKTDHGTWIWPNGHISCCYDGNKFAWCHVSQRINPETGEIYILDIEWKTAEQLEAEKKAPEL